MCNAQPNPKSRNLVVCIDGTSNKFGQNNTNVLKLFAGIDLKTSDSQPKQYAYYTSGIGTRPTETLNNIFSRMERAVSDRLSMAIAWNVEEIVKEAYGWIARTYQEGDQIYLFGFSRGAYQVRVLAGMIHEVGLLSAPSPTEKQIGTAYDHYRSIRSQNPKTRGIAKEFKKTFSRIGLRVHFVGVWDTVSSVGLMRGDVFLSTSSSAAHACHFRHALALDERRVKFMPEYFHEMNAQTDDNKAGDAKNKKSKYISEEQSEISADKTVGEVTEGENSTASGVDKSKGLRTCEIKEVWFAGSHSDVGGKDRLGKSFQAGNVSLSWMRREASANGLILKPADTVWVPDDLDLGTSDSMSLGWKMVEFFPVKHQVSFNGAGGDLRRWHRSHPRRIIPGQKIHVSVLFANAYRPRATLGDGFDIPIAPERSSNTKQDSKLWETGLFDDTAARELLTCLDKQKEASSIDLDMLLFMLRFREGKAHVRQVPEWREIIEGLIENQSGLVRLVTIVAYFEASYDEKPTPTSPAAVINFPQEVFDDARQCFNDILDPPSHPDRRRLVALLRPLTKHKMLRERILTQDVITTLIRFLDGIVDRPGENFTQVMDGLDCLVACDDLQDTVIEQFASNSTRISRMLDVDDSNHLTASLRVVLSLARIDNSKAVDACAMVKPRLHELAKKRKGLVGLLAVEALLASYKAVDQPQLTKSLRNPNIRANFSSVLNRWNMESSHDSSSGHTHGHTGYETLRQLFGLGVKTLDHAQEKLIHELMLAARAHSARERTAATLTLLKLCDDYALRKYLFDHKVLDIFINQLHRKDSSLLAAYALTICLKHETMKQHINLDHLSKYIVNMLRLDYFDDAVGQVEGFQVFGDLMKHDDLRKKITECNIAEYSITEVLKQKLRTGQPNEIRTSLICLDIFRSFDDNGTWISDLVKQSLERLSSKEWRTQKAGVTILSGLAQTKHGVEAIKPHIQEIVKMLLPPGNSPMQKTLTYVSSESSTQPGEASPTIQPPPHHWHSGDSVDSSTKPSSWMLGPACALRVLSVDETLRKATRDTAEYARLKHLYQSEKLVTHANPPSWRVKTPDRHDVVDMLAKMIRAVDEEFLDDGLTSVGDTVLPHISHWDKLATLVIDSTVVMAILPVVLGVSALVIAAGIVAAPFVLSYELIKSVKWQLWYHRQSRAIDRLQLSGFQ